MYELGKGVPQDFNSAVEWYQRAAAQGDSNAQYNLGVLYQLGEGVAQDYTESANWYSEAAKPR
jgi:TPR repeat protein